MDILLAEERAKHEYVKSLQTHDEVPFNDVLKAFEQYRALVQQCVLANIVQAEGLEIGLWDQHTATRKKLAVALRELRKVKERVVEIRIAVEMYARFIRHGVRFYRAFIYELSTHFGGIPELEAVAAHVKRDSPMLATTTYQAAAVSTDSRKRVLSSCYHSLIHLGDLCRYRATDALDKTPNFGAAIAYYDLACTVRPKHGLGYHQQAIVALEQQDFLRAIYYFNRSFLIAEPVAIGKSNLDKQYDIANTAWANGQLISRGPPGDLATTENSMIGWFIRLHSMCAKGDSFRGYDEILQELFTRLKSELLRTSPGATLRRMIFINIGAQHNAVVRYTDVQTTENEQSFYHTMHVNILYFTTFLQLLQIELTTIAKRQELVEAELPSKITPVMTHLLAALRIYSIWLLQNIHLLQGLADNELLMSPIDSFWRIYAQVLDIIAAVFPIWDLEDIDVPTYLLEEDVEISGFVPLDDDSTVDSPAYKALHNAETAALKPRLAEPGQTPLTSAEEMLNRILFFLEVGSFVAENVEETPLFIRGDRFTFGAEVTMSPMPRPPTPPPVPPKKPLSYAAAAANAQSKIDWKAKRDAISLNDDSNVPAEQHVPLVSGVIDDEDTDLPVTPPIQIHTDRTAIIEATDYHQIEASLLPKDSVYQLATDTTVIPGTVLPSSGKIKGRRGAKEDLSDFSPRPKPAENAMIWTPSGKLMSPSSLTPKMHHRVGSGASNRSVGVPRLMDSWSSVDSGAAPKRIHSRQISNDPQGLQAGTTSADEQRVASPRASRTGQSPSPLLFGGSSIWSSTPKTSDG